MISLVTHFAVALLFCGNADEPYLVGTAIEDITGPAYGVQLAGFVRADQISEGVHLKQWARAFVIADSKGARVALVVVDLAFVSHQLKQEVLDRLRSKLGDRYRHDNVLLTATHTHAAPGGFHHYMATNIIGGSFHQQYFDALADGVTEAIQRADASVVPAMITLSRADVVDAGANRSAKAYDANPMEERRRYRTNTDLSLTQLTFTGTDGTLLGVLNWFAVHPTSMTFFNRLISSDNKGAAAVEVERAHGQRYRNSKGFVSAFAQTNCGDVTPNLNLNNTGPGKTDEESTFIIGDRQAKVAEQLLAKPGEPIHGPIVCRHAFINFGGMLVAGEFTGRGDQHTCKAAYGYSFAGGSTEDGGGHPLFREGMTERNALVENIVKAAIRAPDPTDEFRECHKPKAILFAAGLGNPPGVEQNLPVGLIRIGQFTIAVGPSEYTTMTGRRIREAVAKEFAQPDREVVLAGYSNEFCGYTTTWEEYQTQQYEGGHTIFGPWSESAWRQEMVKLARAMKENKPAISTGQPLDLRGKVKDQSFEGADDHPPAGAKFGDVVEDALESYRAGNSVRVRFWTGRPVNEYRRQDRFMIVEKKGSSADDWQEVASDADWETKILFRSGGKSAARPDDGEAKPLPPKPANMTEALKSYAPRKEKSDSPGEAILATLVWRIPRDAGTGEYRIVFLGRYKENGKVVRTRSISRPFSVTR